MAGWHNSHSRGLCLIAFGCCSTVGIRGSASTILTYANLSAIFFGNASLPGTPPTDPLVGCDADLHLATADDDNDSASPDGDADLVEPLQSPLVGDTPPLSPIPMCLPYLRTYPIPSGRYSLQTEVLRMALHYPKTGLSTRHYSSTTFFPSHSANMAHLTTP